MPMLYYICWLHMLHYRHKCLSSLSIYTYASENYILNSCLSSLSVIISLLSGLSLWLFSPTPPSPSLSVLSYLHLSPRSYYNPGTSYPTLPAQLFLSLSLSLSLSSLSLSLSLSLCLSHSISLSLSVLVSLIPSLFFSLSVPLSLSFHFSLSLFLSLCLSHSISRHHFPFLTKKLLSLRFPILHSKKACLSCFHLSVYFSPFLTNKLWGCCLYYTANTLVSPLSPSLFISHKACPAYLMLSVHSPPLSSSLPSVPISLHLS